MEPEHLSPDSSDDARVDEWLRSDASTPLPDDGFSSRVLAALPPRRAREPSRRLWILPALGAAVGLLLIVARGGASPDIDIGPVGGLVNALGSALPKSSMGLALVVIAGLFAVSELIPESPGDSLPGEQ